MAAVRDKAWAGVDVGKTHHWVCAVDADGKTLLSVKIANDEAEIRSVITKVSGLARQRLRAGRVGSGRGAASMVREAIGATRAAGAAGEILVRGDSAYGQQRCGQRLHQGRRPVLFRADQERCGQPGDRLHRRGRLDPGALPRLRRGSRYR